MFAVSRLGLPSWLRTCLTTTNIIDSTHSGIRQRTRRITNWKNGEMALRWSATVFVETEKNYRRVIGHDHLWMLKAHLDRDDKNVAEMQKVGQREFTVAADLLLPAGHPRHLHSARC